MGKSKTGILGILVALLAGAIVVGIAVWPDPERSPGANARPPIARDQADTTDAEPDVTVEDAGDDDAEAADAGPARSVDAASDATNRSSDGDGPGTVTGLVLDEENEPAEGVVVEIWSAIEIAEAERLRQENPHSRLPPNPREAVEVDVRGFFRFDDVPAGEAIVTAFGGGFVRETDNHVQVAADNETYLEFHVSRGRSVAGRVTDKSDTPVKGATVSAYVSMTDGLVQEETRTGEDGRYEVLGLPGTEKANVRTRAEGFIEQARRHVPLGSRNVDFVLTAGALIAGHVVWRGTGAPIAEAVVRPVCVQPNRETGYAGPVTETTDDGAFSVGGLGAGRWIVVVDAAGHPRTISGEIRLETGQQATGVVVELDVGTTVSGMVLSEAGRAPIPDATVGIRAGGPREADGETSTRTDGFGRFSLPHVGPGRQVLRAEHPEHPETSILIEVPEAGELSGLEMLLPTGGAVGGTVYGGDGRPVGKGIEVLLRGRGPMMQGHDTTDDDGRYRISGLPAGRCRIGTMAPNSDPATSIGFGNSGYVETTIRVNETTIVDIHLGGGHSDGERAGGGTIVRGRVTRGREPVAGEILTFYPATTPAGGSGATDPAVGVTADDGAYRIEGVIPGAYVVAGGGVEENTEIPDVPEYVLDFVVPEGMIRGRVVDASTGEPVDHVFVRARRAETGVSDPVLREIGGVHGLTNGDGSFEISGVSDGIYDLDANIGSQWSGTTGVVVTNGIAEGITIRLGTGTALTGRVTDVDGRPARTLVHLRSEADGMGHTSSRHPWALTGLGGLFEFSGLEPGRYFVQAVSFRSAASASRWVEVAEGTTSVVDLQFSNGGRIFAAVVDGSGAPVEGATVDRETAVGLDPPGSESWPPDPWLDSTDECGEYTEEGVPAGSYFLRAVAPGGQASRWSFIEVRDDETSTATLTIDDS